ncbi:hypothetical protein P9246_15670 [Aeribacillus pallidus]|uniref:hypothetical protein n=1 Tax=Aeribacillus composti TaxID=1868734 RepID=UPI002E239CAB|nr:hypothetical protein [Aeribacillus composti]MED4488158.1 hypothetical protein [Aeribacillus pallidus]
MNIQITSINVLREGGEAVGLQVYFTGQNSGQSIYINGNIPLESGEFEQHFQIGEIENIVRNKVVERLLNGESPAAQ